MALSSSEEIAKTSFKDHTMLGQIMLERCVTDIKRTLYNDWMYLVNVFGMGGGFVAYQRASYKKMHLIPHRLVCRRVFYWKYRNWCSFHMSFCNASEMAFGLRYLLVGQNR